MNKLWIRSQDGEKLIECHGFYIAHRTGETENADINGLDVAGKAHYLGTYRNDRAIEVLEGIECLCMSTPLAISAVDSLLGKRETRSPDEGSCAVNANPSVFAYDDLQNKTFDFKELYSTVYEMPKE